MPKDSYRSSLVLSLGVATLQRLEAAFRARQAVDPGIRRTAFAEEVLGRGLDAVDAAPAVRPAAPPPTEDARETHIARFVAACCRADLAAATPLSVLYEAYRDWLRETRPDASPLLQATFGHEMRATGHYARSRNARFYRLRIVDPVAAAPVLPAALAADLGSSP